MADTLCNEENIKKYFLSFYLGKQNIIVDEKRPNMNREIWRTYLSDLLGNLSNIVGTNELLGNLGPDLGPDKTFTIRDDNDVDQTYTVGESEILLDNVRVGAFDEFVTAIDKIAPIKVIYKAIIRKCNILQFIDKNIITELFLTSTPQPSERNNINFWKNFFSDEERYNAIKGFISTINNADLTTLCKESFDLLQDEKKNIKKNRIAILPKLFFYPSNKN